MPATVTKDSEQGRRGEKKKYGIGKVGELGASAKGLDISLGMHLSLYGRGGIKGGTLVE